MFDKIRSDFRAALEMDPAATSRVEVLLTYAGFHALVMHRMAHWLYRMGMPFFARMLSQLARFLTGIEIHPAAKIAGSCFIDHGMGVVIGETTEVGEHVVLYQGVTLGGTGKERGKRHPTVGNHVVIGTGAKVLGNITIGDHVKVGANSVVLKSVPPHSTVIGVPGRVVRQHGEKTVEMAMLDHVHMPDPLNDTLISMQKQISRLEQKLSSLGASPQAEQPPSPGKKGHGKKHGQRGSMPTPKPGVAEILPAETVQERQARMARMEKEERMKAHAIRKAKEAAQTQLELVHPEGEQPPEAGQDKPKKRVRRRRRRGKGGGAAPAEGGEQAAGGEGMLAVAGGETVPTESAGPSTEEKCKMYLSFRKRKVPKENQR